MRGGAQEGALFLEFAPVARWRSRWRNNGARRALRPWRFGRGVWAHLPARSWDGPRGVKSRNVAIGAGRAKLADLVLEEGGADVPIIGARPAFMAPEVARGEQARSRRLGAGCMVVEMATGRARGAALTATRGSAPDRVHGGRAEVPEWLSADGRTSWPAALSAGQRAVHRAQLLEHRSWPPPLSR
ncbi:hypothetical protein ZWY2020_044558 [Hordeum vulgare]|nr:hypothetical protein ZWY2020_044558 [Hordeum vulgare]